MKIQRLKLFVGEVLTLAGEPCQRLGGSPHRWSEGYCLLQPFAPTRGAREAAEDAIDAVCFCVHVFHHYGCCHRQV